MALQMLTHLKHSLQTSAIVATFKKLSKLPGTYTNKEPPHKHIYEAVLYLILALTNLKSFKALYIKT